MGHMGHLKEEYQNLIKRLDAGTVGMPEPEDPEARAAWKEILEIMYTPEEAEIATRLPVKPAGLTAIAARVHMRPEELKPKLDAMCDKGLVMDLVNPNTGRTKYLLSPPVVGFFEFSFMRAHDMFPKKKLAKALYDYTHGDPAFAYEVFNNDTVIGRAMVNEAQLSDDPMPDVLDWERATGVLETASHFAVTNCYCRHKAEHLGQECDAPKEICLSLNAGAEFVVRRNFGRAIQKEEAMEILLEARRSGLVQIADNVRNRVSYICNCCGCCCGQLRAINDYDLPAVNPSAFQPEVDDEACRGCSKCSRACPITAIDMKAVRLASKRKSDLRPHFNRDRCIGCGVCAEACSKNALSMVRREHVTPIPKNAIERSIRMALERGRLAHLLFDEGSSRGHKFANRAIQVLTQLPLAERALASEQVRSRFVRAALSTVKDPTGG